MFDNSNYRAIPPNPGIEATENDSRIVAFQIDEAQRTVEQVYSYGAGQGEKFTARSTAKRKNSPSPATY